MYLAIWDRCATRVLKDLLHLHTGPQLLPPGCRSPVKPREEFAERWSAEVSQALRVFKGCCWSLVACSFRPRSTCHRHKRTIVFDNRSSLRSVDGFRWFTKTHSTKPPPRQLNDHTTNHFVCRPTSGSRLNIRVIIAVDHAKEIRPPPINQPGNAIFPTADSVNTPANRHLFAPRQRPAVKKIIRPASPANGSKDNSDDCKCPRRGVTRNAPGYPIADIAQRTKRLFRPARTTNTGNT